MHFSIPDTESLKEPNGSSYSAFNIHINGVFHCAVRYKQLHNLNEQLKQLYKNLPTFPSKKFLPLTNNQLHERRALLEKYIQTISQDSRIASSEIFNGFLVNAQQETQNQIAEEVDLHVFLLNGHKITIKILSTLQTDDVLETVAAAINIPAQFVFYFALFLMGKESHEDDYSIVRRLQDFESPYTSLKTAKGSHQIILRKSYWDPAYDDDMIDDRCALNLLYIQAVNDIERKWVIVNQETERQLASLQAKGSKKEYIRLARTLKFYGHIQFKHCGCDFPTPNSKVVVTAGNKELVFRYPGNNNQMTEYSFKVIRMRCWRVTTSKSADGRNGNSKDEPKLELTFQYLMCKDNLQWITVESEQTILLSACLQGMVEELLMKKEGCRIKRPQDRPRNGSWSYMKRDGSSHQICVSRSSSIDTIANGSNLESSKFNHRESSVKKLQEILSRVSFMSSVRNTFAANIEIQNDVFEGIGDEDL